MSNYRIRDLKIYLLTSRDNLLYVIKVTKVLIIVIDFNKKREKLIEQKQSSNRRKLINKKIKSWSKIISKNIYKRSKLEFCLSITFV